MATVKRERSTNWDKEEKQLLREIIKPFIETIEKKDLCTNTNKSKLKAWAEITEKFNVANSRFRDKKQIMCQWKTTKINSKKELSKYRKETKKTGGGPKPSSPTQETLEIVNLLPHEFEIDFNEYDCDGVRVEEKHESAMVKKIENIDVTYSKDGALATKPQDVVFEIIKNKENIGEQVIIDAQCEPSPPPIIPKKSARKTPTSRKSYFDFGEASFADMHHFRMLENERLQKEHELRMQQTKELHEQALINLRLQQEILSKQLASLNK